MAPLNCCPSRFTACSIAHQRVGFWVQSWTAHIDQQQHQWSTATSLATNAEILLVLFHWLMFTPTSLYTYTMRQINFAHPKCHFFISLHIIHSFCKFLHTKTILPTPLWLVNCSISIVKISLLICPLRHRTNLRIFTLVRVCFLFYPILLILNFFLYELSQYFGTFIESSIVILFVLWSLLTTTIQVFVVYSQSFQVLSILFLLLGLAVKIYPHLDEHHQFDVTTEFFGWSF